MLSKSTETLFWVSTFFSEFSCKFLACFDDCLSADLFWSRVCWVLVVLVSGNLGNCLRHSQRQWCHAVYINLAHVDSAAFSHWILSEACLTVKEIKKTKSQLAQIGAVVNQLLVWIQVSCELQLIRKVASHVNSIHIWLLVCIWRTENNPDFGPARPNWSSCESTARVNPSPVWTSSHTWSGFPCEFHLHVTSIFHSTLHHAPDTC